MAGIGQAMAPQDEGQAEGAAAPADDNGQQPNVSPEEQAAYDEFVSNGMHLIYRGEGDQVEVNPAVLDQLRGKWDDVKPSLGQIPDDEKPLDPASPIDNLAVTTVALVLALEASAAQSTDGKGRVDPAVVFHGGAELMEQLADIADAAKIHDFTEDEMTGAANRAALLYGVSSKTMNKQEALSEFDHFLKTQGDQLGQSLAAAGQQGAAEEEQPQQGA
jgi:hypothetical protein